MALIKCPECSKDISNKARWCVGCGFPMASDFPRGTSVSDVITIEKTSKSIKIQQIVPETMMLIGFFCLFALMLQPDVHKSVVIMIIVGACMFPIGFIWNIVVNIKGWWRHG